jgi:hypothetical protein
MEAIAALVVQIDGAVAPAVPASGASPGKK